MGAGIHDAGLATLTKDVYIDNVRWYLSLLQQVCSLIFWTANAAPEQAAPSRVGRQYINQTREWNEAVRHLLANEFNRNHTSTSGVRVGSSLAAVAFIDVFEASLGKPHRDNIHMSPDWYYNLSALFHPEKLPNKPCA